MTARCLTFADATRILARLAEAVEEHAGELSALDAALGDGDHGVSLTIGFRAVVQEVAESAPSDIGALLETTGFTLVNAVGGAMGPLYGTAFMRAGKVAGRRREIDGATLAAMIEAGREGIVARGKAATGDKTMLDAIAPAAAAARRAADAGGDAADVLRAASAAADQGARDTRDMLARKGRASKLGERTLGHQDAGAASAALMLRIALLALETPAVAVEAPDIGG
jgi:dihydroxyacetone kinase-like protein